MEKPFRKEFSAFLSLWSVISVIFENRSRMLRVAVYDIKIENRNLYLGTFWKVLTPLIQIGTYWFVFGIGIRSGVPMNGFPFLVWMLAGLIPWFFINRAIITGATSIRAKSGMVFKVKYPVPTIPIGNVIICLYDHVIMLVIMIIIFLFYGVVPSLSWLNLMYYILYMTVFTSSLSLILSIVVMLAQDFSNLINSLMTALFFFTPILWSADDLSRPLRILLSLNPVLYIVDGFRDSLLYGVNFYMHPLRIAYFWIFAFVLLFVGCAVQKKYGSQLVDWM